MSLQINFSDNELQILQAHAAQMGISIDAYIKRVLLTYINEIEEDEDEPYILQGIKEIENGEYTDGSTFINGLVKKYGSI